MSDEIKRVADTLYDRCKFYRENDAKVEIITTLLAERKKAYDECIVILKKQYDECGCSGYDCCLGGKKIANEIRRRMEGI